MSDKKKLLIVDDEYNTRQALMRYLGKRFDVSGACDGTEAIELLANNAYDLVLTDLRMPGADGLSVLEAAAKSGHYTPCILLTAYGSITDAVKAVKMGAFDFVSKPVKLSQLEQVIEAALAAANHVSSAGKAEDTATNTSLVVSQNNDATSNNLKDFSTGVDSFVLEQDTTTLMGKVISTAIDVAKSRASVLLTGESGTGKEVIANLIHKASSRPGAFVAVHCAALTATILESELFGYEKGAFTGANDRHIGKFEAANNGTIFLDEIGEIDAQSQVKLLRVLETHSFERVGGLETVHSNFRLIAATNRNLRQMVLDGTFREDLFYRLSVVNLELPPLRQRPNEIPPLVKSFVEKFCQENERPILGIDDEVLEKLVAYNWQGNIRELRNTIESMVVLAKGANLTLDNLPTNIRNFDKPSSSVILDSSSQDVNLKNEKDSVSKENPSDVSLPKDNVKTDLKKQEMDIILKTLDECGGNRTKAAEVLGISRRTLQRKLSGK
jgi:DNA-binding NtrC family response regulator